MTSWLSDLSGQNDQQTQASAKVKEEEEENLVCKYGSLGGESKNGQAALSSSAEQPREGPIFSVARKNPAVSHPRCLCPLRLRAMTSQEYMRHFLFLSLLSY